jgi:hypothetical protein
MPIGNIFLSKRLISCRACIMMLLVLLGGSFTPSPILSSKGDCLTPELTDIYEQYEDSVTYRRAHVGEQLPDFPGGLVHSLAS